MPLVYTPTGWVDDDGSLTVGTLYTAARMNNIENGIVAATAGVNSITSGTTSIEAWHVIGTTVGGVAEPTFQNGWTNFGSGYETAAFKKYPDGRVRLRGLVATGTLGVPIFTLPVGYRPVDLGAGGSMIFADSAVGAYGEIRIDGSGNVVLQAGATAWCSLDGIEFDTGASSWPAGPKGDTGPPGLSAGSMEDFAEVKVVVETNVNIANPGTRNWDSDTVGDGQRVLLNGQTTASQNGIYVLNGTAVPMTRATDADASAEFLYGRRVRVTGGAVFKRSIWSYSGASLPTIGTTALTFRVDAIKWAWTWNGPGAWLTGTLTSTQGVAFTVPVDGIYLFHCHTSLYANAANSDLRVRVYLDGNGGWTIPGFTNEGLSHKALVPVQFTFELAKGVHYIGYSTELGLSNNGDFGSISATLVQ